MDEQEVKVIIKSLLGSSQTKMNQRDLHRQFQEFTGIAIPYRQFGFKNAEEYLHSLRDTCIIHGTGPFALVTAILSSNSAHIVKMISKQKTVKGPKHKIRNSSIIMPVQQPPPMAPRFSTPKCQRRSDSTGIYKLQQQFKEFQEKLKFDNHKKQQSSAVNSNNHKPRDMCENREFGKKQVKNDIKQVVDNMTQNRDDTRLCSVSSPLKYVNGINVNTELSTLVSTKMKITQEIYDENLNGEHNVEENNIPLASSSSSFDHDINYKVPHEVQENLKRLIVHFPEGLWLKKLPDEYKRMFGTELNYAKYKYMSLVQMCISLDYIFIYKHLRKDGGKLYNATCPIPEDPIGELLQLADELGPVKEEYKPCVNAITIISDYPHNVMHPDDTIPVETMDLKKLYTPIMVAEVYDLSKFWFILAENDVKLDELENDLETFYNLKYKQYEIPDVLLRKGLFVIAFIAPREYHRAVVVRISEKLVKLFCVDSGMVINAPRDTIYYMHKQFSQVPRQGLRGRLSGLMPPTKQEQWSRDAAYRFLQLVKDSTLYGSVAATDDSESDLIYELVLCDSSFPEDVFIHDILMQEEYAIATDQEQQLDESLYGDYKCLVENLHLYPTFCELELHLVPNAIEMRRLIAFRVPLHHIYPIYFKSKTKSSIIREVDTPLRCFVKRMTPRDIEPHEQSTDIDESNEENSSSSINDTTESAKSITTTPPLPRPPPGFDYSMRNSYNAQLQNTQENYNSQKNRFDPYTRAAPIVQLQQNIVLQQRPQQDVENFALYQRQLQWNYRLACQNNYMMQQYPYNCNNWAWQNQRFDRRHMNSYHNMQNPAATPFVSTQNANDPQSYHFHGDNQKILEHTVTNNDNDVLIKQSNLATNKTMGTSPLKNRVTKRNVIVQDLGKGKSIHVVRIMNAPCVIPIEIQEVFTGHVNPTFLGRHLNLSEIITSEVRLERINLNFYNELLENKLIKNGQGTLEYTNLQYLPELIGCIINDDFVIHEFDKILKMLVADSPIWDI